MFEIDERLASGGMGEVYRGHNVVTGDPVAIKVVLNEFAKDETIVGLFFKEARILNSLHHAAIVRYSVFSIDPTIERAYLVMEYIDGPSLSQVVEGAPMETLQAMSLISRLASGLDTAHRAGVIHRDISPDNVILPNSSVENAKIIDFGIARASNLDTGTLLGGKFAGKYNFVSPEQLGLFGGVLTEASDVYSLGLVTANAVLGHPIDMNGSQYEVIEKRRSVPDLVGIAGELRPILERMLEPNPADRTISMVEISQLMAAPVRHVKSHLGEPRTRVAEPTRIQPARQPLPFEVAPKANSPSIEGFDRGADEVDPLAAIPVEVGPQKTGEPKLSLKSSARPEESRSLRKLIFISTLILIIAAGGVGLFLLSGDRNSPETTVATGTKTPPSLPDPGSGKPAESGGNQDIGGETPVQQPPDSNPKDINPSPSPDYSNPATTLQETTSSPPQNAVAPPAAPSVPGGTSNGSPVHAPATVNPSSPAPPQEPPPSDDVTVRPTTPSLAHPKGDHSSRPPEPPTNEPPLGPPPGTNNPGNGPVRNDTDGITSSGAPPRPATPPAIARPAAWVENFNGGPCFFAQASGQQAVSMTVEAIASDSAAMARLDADFTSTFGTPADIHGQLIQPSQCGLVTFLRTMARTPTLSIDLDKYDLDSGDMLRGRISGPSSDQVTLYMIDHDGVVFPLNPYLTATATGSSFMVGPLQIQSRSALPQLVLALSSDSALTGMSEASTGDQLFTVLSGIGINGSFKGNFGVAYWTLRGD
ncbi:serine/threonine-protein kinase [Rhizobium laguerreae]|nr:serine/threonine-protein kinase [Rhizobium laguerreae]MBY3348004.1 protein kinase [Rhizobium laguerreae]MBY3354967.1 protein kinase [Rhizobium laguerreae]MBY3431271.1 protein kinase [Rhizobium laguerreae]MBY3439886.1 protein kinase [Rhizobium laguerreae]MBY3453978.1 protein kinase [Rhizobium laguerreae]